MATLDSSTGALTKAGFLPYGASNSTSGTFRYTVSDVLTAPFPDVYDR